MKARDSYIKFTGYIIMSNGHRDKETPEPISNSEAKLVYDAEYCPLGGKTCCCLAFILTPSLEKAR